MTIGNMSGNFQPLKVESGSTLPSSKSEQTVKEDDNNVSSSGNSNQVSESNVSNNVVALNSANQLSQDRVDASRLEELIQSQEEDSSEVQQNISRRLQFQVDESVGVTVVSVIDKETDELIRQFPPEELLNLSRRLKELNEEDASPTGLLLQEKV